MRTTLNIDDDVAAELAAQARAQGRSLSRVANELIRRALAIGPSDILSAAYEPPTFDTGRPLADITDVSAALDALDAADGR
jgi:hypothetical protein